MGELPLKEVLQGNRSPQLYEIMETRKDKTNPVCMEMRKPELYPSKP